MSVRHARRRRRTTASRRYSRYDRYATQDANGDTMTALLVLGLNLILFVYLGFVDAAGIKHIAHEMSDVRLMWTDGFLLHMHDAVSGNGCNGCNVRLVWAAPHARRGLRLVPRVTPVTAVATLTAVTTLSSRYRRYPLHRHYRRFT